MVLAHVEVDGRQHGMQQDHHDKRQRPATTVRPTAGIRRLEQRTRATIAHRVSRRQPTDLLKNHFAARPIHPLPKESRRPTRRRLAVALRRPDRGPASASSPGSTRRRPTTRTTRAASAGRRAVQRASKSSLPPTPPAELRRRLPAPVPAAAAHATMHPAANRPRRLRARPRTPASASDVARLRRRAERRSAASRRTTRGKPPRRSRQRRSCRAAARCHRRPPRRGRRFSASHDACSVLTRRNPLGVGARNRRWAAKPAREAVFKLRLSG